MKQGDEISGIFTVQETEIRNFTQKPGKYLRLRLSDASATITAVCFDPELLPFEIKSGMRIGLKAAQVKTFQTELRLYFYPGSIFKAPNAG
ncbi:MAG: hypothetical protein ACMXYC_00115 [Candidatus Woesearchaeota archaeon]